MGSFAVMLSSKLTSTDGILMMVDERHDAEEIASELCHRGQAVTVLEITPDRFPSGDPQARQLTL